MDSTVERHLRDLLFEQDAVSIPGLGTLQTYYTSASIDEELGKVHPPAKKLRFEEDAHGDGDELINMIVRKEGKSTFDARMKVEEFVEQVRMGSRNDQGHTLEGLGIFRANSLSSGNPSLDFEPDPNTNFNMSTYGLNSVNLPGKSKAGTDGNFDDQPSTIESHYQENQQNPAPIVPITAHEEPKRVSEVLEERLREDRKVAEEAENTDYLDKLREEFERKKREDELKRRATIAGGAVAGTTALAGGFLANKKNKEPKKEVVKEVKPTPQAQPAEKKSLITEIKKEPVQKPIEKTVKEPPRATFASKDNDNKSKVQSSGDGSRNIFDVLSENVVSDDDPKIKEEKKGGSALYWVLPLLMLILLGVLAIQLDINNTDLRSVFGFGKETPVAENNAPIAAATETEEENEIPETSEEIRKAVAASEADLAAMEAEEEEEEAMATETENLESAAPTPEETTPKASSYDQNGNPITENSQASSPKDPTARSGSRNSTSAASQETAATPMASEQKDPSERSGTRAGSSQHPSGYFAGIGVFGDKGNATKLAAKLRSNGEDAYAVPMNGKTAVVIYAGDTKANAQGKLQDVRNKHEKDAWLRFLK